MHVAVALAKHDSGQSPTQSLQASWSAGGTWHHTLTSVVGCFQIKKIPGMATKTNETGGQLLPSNMDLLAA